MDAKTAEQLIQKCIDGDRRTQYQLFNEFKEKVLNLVYKTLGPRFDIDEVVQEVFVSVFRSLPRFKGLSSIDTWIYRIAVKVCTDQLRKKYRKRQISEVSADESLINDTDTPQHRLERRELEDKVHEALEKLSPEKRVVVVLYEMEGRTIEEIAVVINKPAGTVKSRLFHGRNELQKHLRRYIGS